MTADTRLLVLFASALYMSMGVTHCLVALRDERNGLIFMRSNDSLLHSLRTTQVWFARRSSGLSTHQGLNLSHGIGVAIFGLMVFMLAWRGTSEVSTDLLLKLSTGASMVYFVVAWRYWFGIPTFGYALGALLYLSACFMHWS